MRLRLALALACGAPLLSSCYEIPPEIPADYVGSEPRVAAWPPAAAYDPDPLHPANRWFQRAFGLRNGGGRVQPAFGSEPLPHAEGLAPADLAELLALLDAAREEPIRDAVLRAVFRSDCLALALALGDVSIVESEREAGSASGDRAVRRALARRLVGALESAARVDRATLDALGVETASSAAPARLAPPPLRGAGSPRNVLLRQRIALDGGGEPVLLPLASECLELGAAVGDGVLDVRSAWRFDRTRRVRGEDPWIPVPPPPSAAGLEGASRTAGLSDSRRAAIRARLDAAIH